MNIYPLIRGNSCHEGRAATPGQRSRIYHERRISPASDRRWPAALPGIGDPQAQVGIGSVQLAAAAAQRRRLRPGPAGV